MLLVRLLGVLGQNRTQWKAALTLLMRRLVWQFPVFLQYGYEPLVRSQTSDAVTNGLRVHKVCSVGTSAELIAYSIGRIPAYGQTSL